MSHVVGLDLSLTCTGIATVYQDPHPPTTDKIVTKGHRGDSSRDQYRRRVTITNKVLEYAFASNLIVIEGPAMSRNVGSMRERAELVGRIKDSFSEAGDAFIIVGPTQLKRWATGAGNADKAAVASSVTRIAGIEIGTSDEADALALALIGAQVLGWTTPTNTHQRSVIDTLREQL